MDTSFSTMEEGKNGSSKKEKKEILFLSSSESDNPYRRYQPENGDMTENTRRPVRAGSYDPSNGEFFEKRETKLDGDRKRVTYILQSSGSHRRARRSRGSAQLARSSTDEHVASNDSHCHSLLPKSTPDNKAKKKLILANVLCLLFMVGETVGGLMAGSLAIISDAAHLLTDFASFMISLAALMLAQRPATKKLSFGWYRIEILGALMSVLMLWVLTGILVYSAVERIYTGDYEINASIMLITAGTGVAFNILLGSTLHQHGHSHGGGGHGHSHGGHGHSHGGHGHSHGGQAQNSSHKGHSNDGTDHYQSVEKSPVAQNDAAQPSTGASTVPAVTYSNGKKTYVAAASRRYGAVDVTPGPQGTSTDVLIEEDKETQALLASGSSDVEGHSDKGHSHSTSNINVKAAFIHVVGDLCQSVGVLVAAFIIYYKPEWKIADPICTFLFSLFVIITTITILRDIIVVLMEGTPRGINFAEVRETFFKVEGVLDIHNLRVWSLTMDKIALSVHIAVDKKSDPHAVLKQASSAIQSKFAIAETTMQVEEYVTEMDDCADCQGPKL